MASKDKRIINVRVSTPLFEIGQTVYVPQKNKAKEATITGYNVIIFKGKSQNLEGKAVQYHIDAFVWLRRGDETELLTLINREEFYENKEEAEKASRFLSVTLDDLAWKKALGDEKEKDEDSPYNLARCNFPPCCGNIDEARNILAYCKRNKGLMVHYRDEFVRLAFPGHQLKVNPRSPLARAYKQLEINPSKIIS